MRKKINFLRFPPLKPYKYSQRITCEKDPSSFNHWRFWIEFRLLAIMSLVTSRITMRIFLFLFLSQFCLAQSLLLLERDKLQLSPSQLFIAGDFNNWQAGDSNYAFVNDSLWTELSGKISFKVTGKSWQEVEASAQHMPITNRELFIKNQQSYKLQVLGWEGLKPNAPAVLPRGLTKLMPSQELTYQGKERSIWVYLPKNFNKEENYPLLYLHDGQNLFSGLRGSPQKWQIAETLDSLNSNFIIVAIAHGEEKRIAELSPYPNSNYGGGAGDQYLQFIAQQLHPFIKEHYPVYGERAHTFIGGSSLGALISVHALLKHQDLFGGALVFSPSYWFNPQLAEDASGYSQKKRTFVYQLIGGNEGRDAQSNVQLVLDMEKGLQSASKNWIVETKVVAKGEHNELFWHKEFPAAILWLSEQMRNNDGARN